MNLSVTAHAADRYVERVKSHLSRREATRELLRLADAGSWEQERPEWLKPSEARADAYLLIADGIALPLFQTGPDRYAVTTVLIRAGQSDGSRKYRNRLRKRRRQRVRSRGSKSPRGTQIGEM